MGHRKLKSFLNLIIITTPFQVAYLFTVRAKTLDLGPPITGNVTTGPQDGSPGRPKDLQLGKTVSSVDLHWTNGNSGKGPILGYYIQTRRKGGSLLDFCYCFGCGLVSTNIDNLVWCLETSFRDYKLLSYEREVNLFINFLPFNINYGT